MGFLDQLQNMPIKNNPSDRTVLDGPTQPARLSNAQTATNKAIARGFVNDILIGNKTEKLAQYVKGDQLIQHNHAIADGVLAWLKHIADSKLTDKPLQYSRVRMTLGEGDFVLIAGEGTVGVTPLAFYNLFRLVDGKIAEHWECIQEIPPLIEWRNNNGKF